MMTLKKAALVASIVGIGCQRAPEPARYLYVWAGSGNDTTDGADVVTVIDADPSSSKYGMVMAALTVDSAGRMPHHTEFSLPTSGAFAANDFSGNKSFLIDYKTPLEPRLAGRFDPIPGGRKPHSFARLSNGHILATVQFGDSTDAGNPGMLAEFDENGKFVRSGSSRDSAFPGERIRTYALTTLPAIDRVVTTSAPMDSEKTAHVVQVWRLSDLRLLKTLRVPEVAGDSAHQYPFEVRTMADGKTVMMNTYMCGFYLMSDLDREPAIERVMSMEQPKNVGCSVPVTTGKYMLMPIAYAHRFATLDISNPAAPKEVASFATDSTFFPHWAALDPGSDRVVFSDQGDRPPRVMIGRFNPTTGALTLDHRFADPNSSSLGISYHRELWPNGLKGMLMPHGALFVR